MKTTLIFLSIIFLGCSSKKDVFKESDYILVKSDSSNGNIGTQWYLYKYDGLRTLQVDYWSNGKLMAKRFLYKGKPDGKRIMFDFDGKTPLAIDSFSNGTKVVSNIYFKPDTTAKIFKDGELKPFTSLDSIK